MNDAIRLSTIALMLAALAGSACKSEDEPCTSTQDDAKPAMSTAKTVRVTNSTASPVWLPGYYCGAPGDGSLSRLRMTIDGQDAIDVAPECTRCSTLQSNCWGTASPGDNCCEGEGICPETIRIGPGESYDLEWQPYAWAWVELDPECRDVACSEQTSCWAGRVVEPGTQVELRLAAVFGCEYTDPSDPPDSCGECAAGQTCVLASSGACYNGSSGFDIEAVATVELTADDAVIELVFQ